MKTTERDQVLLWRKNDRLSYGEIRKKIKVSKSTLSRWLKDLPLSAKEIHKLRQINWSKGEASRERFRETMRQKKNARKEKIYIQQKKLLSNVKKRERFIAGLILYLAEGSKTSMYSIVLTNTDPKILKFFIKWAGEFLNIPPKDMRGQLHLYENMNIPEEKRYWRKELGFKSSQFYKDQIRKIKANTYSYKDGFRHGTCQVSYVSGEKKMLLMESIRAFIDNCYKDMRV